MENSEIIDIIKRRFDEMGNPTQIPLLKGDRSFEAKLSMEGIYVDNLGNQPFLPWTAFTETVSLLKRSGGRAARGDAMNSKLGERFLPINSVEGHIAHVIYGKQKGDTVFRRVTPITCILIWAKICRHEPNDLVLSDRTTRARRNGGINALKERTDAKIGYAKLMHKELTQRPPSAGRGDLFERAHEEAVLFHVIGAKDAFLQEINAVYGLGLKPSEITENNLAINLVKKGETSSALQELILLKEDKSSWLSEANRLRNQGTHRGGLARTFFAGGEHDGEVFYNDQKDPSKHIADEDTYLYLEHCIEAMEALILRLRAML